MNLTLDALTPDRLWDSLTLILCHPGLTSWTGIFPIVWWPLFIFAVIRFARGLARPRSEEPTDG